jgi:UDP-N-acetylmuramoyl-tripeptide--D-alanyl-D-alanine ligase
MLVAEKMKFNIDDIISAFGAGLEAQPAFDRNTPGFRAVSTDSRTIKEGDLFFAIKGETFDGHDFADQAIARGASGVVVSNDYKSSKAAVFTVRNTLEALGDLAALVRSRHHIKCAAITGSNGKTTTKEMLAACLESRLNTYKSPGNFNNLIGLPLSMFHLDENHEAAVLELGMNASGEISRLAEICKPHIGAFTNVAPVHLEYLGTIEAVARAKFELVERLPDNGVIVLNADDPILATWAKLVKQDVITYGLKGKADIKVEKCEVLPEGRCRFVIDKTDFEINFPGEHNIYNAACAIATASLFGLESSGLSEILRSIKTFKLRSEIIHHGGLVIINDCYNANPTSMKKAIDILAQYPARGRKIAVLADMLELGDSEIAYHIEIGEYLKSKNIDSLFATGQLANHFLGNFTGEYKIHSDDKLSLARALIEYTAVGDVILIKGSRGMALEEITAKLMENG